MNPGAKEVLLRDRVLEILDALALQWPSLSVTVDLWRLNVVSQADDYSDKQTEVWIRLAEAVPAFFINSVERWYQKEEGIVRMNANWIITPALYGLKASDHIILNGEAYMVVDVAEQAGISKAKIDRPKSRFQAPARTTPVYRQLGMKAHIA